MAEAAADPRKVIPRAVRAGSGDIILPKTTKVTPSSGTGPEGDKPPKKEGTEPPVTATPVSAPVAEPAKGEAPNEPQDAAPESAPVAKSEASPSAVETPAVAAKPEVVEAPAATDAVETPAVTEAPAMAEVPAADIAMPVAHDTPVKSAEPPVASAAADKPKAADKPLGAKTRDTVNEVAKADSTASEKPIFPDVARNQDKTGPNAEGGFGKKRILIASLIVGLAAVAAACIHIARKRRSLSSGEGRRKKK
jgi:hypothetical protein